MISYFTFQHSVVPRSHRMLTWLSNMTEMKLLWLVNWTMSNGHLFVNRGFGLERAITARHQVCWQLSGVTECVTSVKASQICGNPLFVQHLVRVNNKETIIAPTHWPFVRRTIDCRWIPAQRVSNAKALQFHDHAMMIKRYTFVIEIPQLTNLTGFATMCFNTLSTAHTRHTKSLHAMSVS